VEETLSFVEPARRWAHSPSLSKTPGTSYQGTMKTSVSMLKTSERSLTVIRCERLRFLNIYFANLLKLCTVCSSVSSNPAMLWNAPVWYGSNFDIVLQSLATCHTISVMISKARVHFKLNLFCPLIRIELLLQNGITLYYTILAFFLLLSSRIAFCSVWAFFLVQRTLRASVWAYFCPHYHAAAAHPICDDCCKHICSAFCSMEC